MTHLQTQTGAADDPWIVDNETINKQRLAVQTMKFKLWLTPEEEELLAGLDDFLWEMYIALSVDPRVLTLKERGYR